VSLIGFPGETVRFRLSPEGIAALGEMLEAGFWAKTAGSDEFGVWIDLGDESAMLLKWQYLATMAVSLPPDDGIGPQAKRIGF
jgi:hypothetical protein